MNSTEYIGKSVIVKIDRPLGSLHPTYGFPYPINYGYIEGVLSGDGEELDAYLLEVKQPLDSFSGTCIAVIHRLTEEDDKLIVVPDGTQIEPGRMLEQVHFQEQYFTSELILARRPSV